MADHVRRIEHLIFTYAELLDDGDFEGAANLFRHGRIAASSDVGPEGTFEGHDGVLAMYQNSVKLYLETGMLRTRHLTTNLIVELGPDGPDFASGEELDASGGGAWSATGRAFYTVLEQTETLGLQPTISGRYHDSFHHIDGDWWFDTRIMFVDAVGDMSQHLTFQL